jgi:outer membrane protein TolC
VPALVAAAKARRGELAALAQRAAAARQAALAPRLGIVPTLDGRGTYRWTNEAGLSGREEDWNVALTLSWALFDGGSRAAVAAELAAVAREAELTLAEAERRVAVEVEQAAQDLEAADAAFAEAEAQQRAARQNAEEVRERYRAGLATALEQADAQVAEFEAEAALARQGFARAISRLALERSVGGEPLPSPLEPALASEAAAATETR